MARLTLKQMFLNEIENKNYSADELAVKAGYARGGGLTKVLKDEKKEFENKFFGLLNLVQELYEDQEFKLLEEYALGLDVKKQTARTMIEYCEINKLFATKKHLLEKMINCGNVFSEEWAEIYLIEQLFSEGEITLNEAVKRYSVINPKLPETKVSLEIYKSYCYLQEQQYGMIYHSIVNVDEYLEEIKEPYIKNLYKGRYQLLMIEHFVRKNELENARKYAELLLENEYDMYKAWAYLHLGNSYIVESFDKAYEYLKRGFEISNKKYANVNLNIKRSLNFLCNVWKVEPEYLTLESSNPSDIHEIVFFYINKNQKTEAEKSLNLVDVEKLTFNQKGFHFYLKGLLYNDLDFFSESVSNFMESGDYYFRKLPLLELERMNVPASLLRALSK